MVAYTLDTELRRMKYSIVAEDGRRIGGAAFAPGAERGQGEQGVGDVSSVAGGTAIRDFLSGRRDSDMLRMANQSIFADMLQVRVFFFAGSSRFASSVRPLFLATFCKIGVSGVPVPGVMK